MMPWWTWFILGIVFDTATGYILKAFGIGRHE